MLSTSPVPISFDDDEWLPPTRPPLLCRPSSVSSWKVTSIGRGHEWVDDEDRPRTQDRLSPHDEDGDEGYAEPESDNLAAHGRTHFHSFQEKPLISLVMTSSSPEQSPQTSCRPSTPSIPPLARSPSSPRPRRRSSQQRVSLIAGRVSIAPIEPPSSPPPMLSGSLRRTPSSGSVLSNISTRAPSPSTEPQSFLGGRNISEFLIEGEIGRGAYGLVKRAREYLPDGSVGVSSINCLLSDCIYRLVCSASPGYQTSYQVSHSRALLEKAP